MSQSAPSLVRLERSPLTQLIARVLVLTLLSWSLPFDAALPRRAAADATAAPAARVEAPAAAPSTLYVNGNVAAACQGKAPCFTTIQGAIDAVGAGQRIEIQAGTYVERLEIERKNAGARASEADRIVIEADPAEPPGSVLLRGRASRCEGGYAIDVSRSKYVTIRGLTIVGAGGRGIGLRGGSLENRGIHIERNRLARGGPRECNGGIDVGRGNPQTVIANNLIYGNGRNGILFRDGRGGSYRVVGNTIARNAWSGIQITHAAAVDLVNNVIVGNGTDPGAAQTRVGVRRLKTNPSPASQVRLLGNVVCGNVGGELAGPLLDATDSANQTPTGTEGPGVAASASCASLTELFRDADGADGVVDTEDDDFHLLPGAVAIDAGVDPRLLGHAVANAVYEADFDGAGARPRDGDGDQAARFDAGAHESSGDAQPTPTAPPTTTPSPDPVTPTPATPTPPPTATPGPTFTPVPTAEPTATPEPTAEPTPTPDPVACLSCDACGTGQPGICSVGRTFCDGPFAEPECRTTVEPRTESCGNAIDEDCDGEIDEGGVPEQLPTTPPQTGVFVEPLGTTITFFNQGSAIGLAQGDFDQDGLVDLATAEDANVHDGRRVSITFGNGNGTFSAPTYLALAPQHAVPQSVLAHDFDRDGPLDLLVAMRELQQVYFYRGDGSGGFAAPVPSSVGGLAHQIQTADLNCDGILDVATIVDATHVTVGFGNGDGSFGPTTSYLFNNNLADLALTDVNGDGHPDLVAGSHEYAPLTGIGVRLNDGAGQFGDLKHTAGYTLPDQFGNRGQVQVFGIQIADYDGDTVPDAVASTQGPTGCFTFMKGNGDGTFTPPDHFDGLADRDPSWTCVGSGNLMRRYTENVAPDVDADGKPDVLFYWDENRVVVGIGRGDGTFEARAFAASPGSGFPGSQTYQRADGSGVLAAIVADLNGDCMLDLVTNHRQTNGAHGRQGVLLARAPGDFHAPRIAPLLRDPTGDSGNQMERGVVAGDFDNDGNPDFAAGVGRAFFTVPGAGIGIDIWKGNGDGRGEALPITLNNFAGTGSAYLRTADFDQDGFLDFVFQGGDGPFGRRHSVSTVFGQGDFTFVDRQSAYSPRLDADEVHIRNIITADLDGDEDPDVVALYDNGGWNKWFATFSNTGTRGPLQFVQEVEVGQGSNGRGIVAADFDGDDVPDLIAQDSGFADPQRVRLFKGNGDLTLQPGVTIWDWTAQGAAAAEDFAAADLDGDGDQDLVMAQYYHACAYVLLGHDDGTFDAPVCYPFWTSRTNRLAIDDFDVDGSLDIVAGVEDGGLMFLRGRGDGTFETTQMYAVGRANTQAVNVADFDRDGRPDLLWSYNDSNFGHSIVLSNATGAVPTPTPAPTATLPPGVTHTPRPTPTPTPTPRPTGTPPEDLASLVVEPVDPIILGGETQQFTATGVLDDGTSVDLTAAVAWSSGTPAAASIGAGGLATGLTGGGTSVITAAIGSFSGTSTLTVGARVAGDGVDPVAEITSPAANAEVTQPVDVVGTATDANFLEYELAIAPAGETAFTRIGGGGAPVANGVLGQLDPTLLINDLYTLRLTVRDRGGNETTASIVVQIAREMKVGQFTLSFADVSVPTSGLPIGALRTYDSRDKQKGDFGIGWQLEIQSIRIRTNRVLGTGWTRVVSGPVVSLLPTDQHKVSVTLANGRVEEFDLQVSPTSQIGSLDATMVVGFAKRPGTRGTLEALANSSLLVFAGGTEDELVDDLTLHTYDPRRYRYTDLDGTQIEVDLDLGVQKVTDTNGNQLTVGPNGITHSSGKSISFVRDADGRITQLTDPMGRIQTYAYDARGDLTSHTDALGNETTFAYDRRHNLIRVIDPLDRPVARNEYDDAGRLIAVTDARGNRITLTHDVAGRTEVVTDRLGRATVMTYDDRGNVLSSTNALSETTTFTWDAFGNPLTVTDPLGRTTTYTYDANGRTASVTDPLGNAGGGTYDARGRQLTATDARGKTVTYGYDARGNQTSITDPLGHVSSYPRDAAGNIVSLTDPAGAVVTREYDASGNLEKMIDEAGVVIDFAHDGNGNLTSQTDGGGLVQTVAYDDGGRPTTLGTAGAVRTVGYDAAGQITQVTTASGTAASIVYDALGQIAEVSSPAMGTMLVHEYDAEGNLTASTDLSGNTTRFEYDAADRLVKTTYPSGATELRDHDAAGQLVAFTDRRGMTTTFGYDAAGRMTTITDPLGGVTTRGYDAAGNLTSETSPLLRTTAFAYDDANRLTRTTYADGSFEERAYDAMGRLTQLTDPAGNLTSYTYDDRGRLASVTDALGNVTSYAYDDPARTTTLTDANGNATAFDLDVSGNVVRTTYPGGDTEQATYDTAGRITSRTNGNGETVSYAYDASGLLVTTTLPGGGTETYTYTPDRLVATVTDARGTTSFAYDPTTRELARVTEPDGRYVRYAYDAGLRRTLMAHAAGAGEPEDVTRYTYDALGRLETVTDPAGGVTSYTYDADGNLTSTELPNGTTVEQTFDLRNRVTLVAHRDPASATIASFVYTLDALGNRISVGSADGTRVEYDYDDTSRVTAERHYDTADVLVRDATYTYDPAGNVTARSGSLGSVTWTYDARNQLVSGGGITYAYDGAGNLRSATAGAAVTTYEYDARGRMTRFSPPAGAPTDYEYDFLGLRQQKSGPGGTIDFLNDRTSLTGFAQVVRETDATGDTLRTYAHGSDLLARFEGGASSYHHADALGSTRLLTDAAGAVTDTFTYAAYGPVVARTGTSAEPYQFAGEQRDAESGLTYLRARYYDPSIGRLLARDPVLGDATRPLTLNKYLYANGNPTNVVDPSGLTGQPTTVAEVSLTQGIQGEMRASELQSFVRNARKLSKFTGRVYQYLGATFTTIAVVEAFEEKRPLMKFFANIPLGAPPSLTSTAILAYTAPRLGTLSASMFAKEAEYELESALVGGKISMCGINEYALAIRSPVKGRTAGTIVLCPNIVRSPPLPTSVAGMMGGFEQASGMGIMVHEWSHLILKTIDDKYLCSRAAGLPANQQRDNADNYRCAVESYAVLAAKDLVDDLLGP
jgi:RHS repeat-associated protein